MFALFIVFSGTEHSSSTRDTSLEEILQSMSEVDDTPELIGLLEQILVFDPFRRPEVSGVLRHPWFKGSSSSTTPSGSPSSSTTSSEPPSERPLNLSTSAVAILDRYRYPRPHLPRAPPNLPSFWISIFPEPLQFHLLSGLHSLPLRIRQSAFRSQDLHRKKQSGPTRKSKESPSPNHLSTARPPVSQSFTPDGTNSQLVISSKAPITELKVVGANENNIVVQSVPGSYELPIVVSRYAKHQLRKPDQV